MIGGFGSSQWVLKNISSGISLPTLCSTFPPEAIRINQVLIHFSRQMHKNKFTRTVKMCDDLWPYFPPKSTVSATVNLHIQIGKLEFLFCQVWHAGSRQRICKHDTLISNITHLPHLILVLLHHSLKNLSKTLSHNFYFFLKKRKKSKNMCVCVDRERYAKRFYMEITVFVVVCSQEKKILFSGFLNVEIIFNAQRCK